MTRQLFSTADSARDHRCGATSRAVHAALVFVSSSKRRPPPPGTPSQDHFNTPPLLLPLISSPAAASLSTRRSSAPLPHADARQRAVGCENASGASLRVSATGCGSAPSSQHEPRRSTVVTDPRSPPRLPRFSLRFRSSEDGAAASSPQLLLRTKP